MAGKKSRYVVAVLVAAVVVGGGWVVGIGPQLAASSRANASRATVMAANATNQVILAKLKNDFQNIDALKNSLISLRQSVPTAEEISTFVTELNKLASGRSVIVKSISVSDAKPYTPNTQVAPSTNGTVSATLVTDPKITSANFIVVPVQFAVTGDYSKVLDFVHDVQYGKRLFLVTSLSTTGSTSSKSNSAKSVPTTSGTVDATLGGYLYVLLNRTS